MVVKIVNPSYSYLGGAKVSFSATVQLLTDDEAVELYSKTIAITQNLQDSNWKDKMIKQYTAEAQSVVDKYKEIMSVVQQAYPDAASPEEAMTMLAEEVQGKVVT